MTANRLAALLALAVPLVATAFPPLPKPKDNKAAAKDLAKAIQGTWEVTTLERGGAAGKAAAMTYAMTMTITGTKMSRTLKLKDRELKAADATIVLDVTKAPPWFDVKSGPVGAANMKGIVKVDGDKMIWVFGSGTGERPKTIGGELGNLQFRYTLKRVKP